MQPKFTLKRPYTVFGITALFFALSLFGTRSHAQVYNNANISTGATSNSGVTAPAGKTWSECQNPTGNTTVANTNAGYGAQIASNNALADDFTVTGTWNVTKITVYAYSTGYTGTASPFNDLRIRIHNGNPAAGPTTIVFGDLTTNRLSASNNTDILRIFNTVVPPATAPANNRQIFTLEANVSISLPAGTYWLEYQTGTTLASNFVVPATPIGVRTLPGYNAVQRIGTTWGPVIDAGQGAPSDVPLDMAFRIDYTTGPCAGTPAPGNTVSSLNPVCPGTSFTLSPQNSTAGSGVTYQWQESTNGTTWTNISGATNPTYTTTVAGRYYRVQVTCTGNTGTSTPLQVLVAPPSACYCTASGGTFEKIGRVQFGTIDNTSTLTTGYSDYTSISTNVIQGQVLPLTVTITGAFAEDQVIAWIDFNQNGNFTDAGEQVYMSPMGVGPHTGNVTIPTTALTGPTRMRIRLHDAVFGPNPSPCGTAPFGEVEDYTVNIQPCVVGAITTHPTSQSIQCSNNASFTVATSGSILTYGWEYRVNSSSAWQPVTNTGIYSGATTPTLTLTNVPATFNGYQYRALYSGPCNGIDFSNAATLTVTPLVANVSPASATICTGTIQQLTLTNASSPATSTFNATGMPLVIPDGDFTGVSNTVVASGIPAGAVLTNVSVTFNMTHTWVGDIVMNLTGPNGQTINLIAALNNGNGDNGTDHFVNTVISSTGTTPLSGAPAPRTGTFRADLFTATIPTIAPTTANTWGAITSGALNGNWRLSICDIFALDQGTLTSWSLSLTYGAPAAGVWSSANAGSMWANSAATVPYTGTPTNTIWVNPTTTSTYSVVYSTPTPCTSNPTNVTVNVVNPVSNVVAPVNRAVCVGGNTTFTAGATGGPFTWAWEVSSDGGATWTTVSGATSPTLSLSNVTQTMNNYRYRARITASPCAGTTTTAAAILTVNPLPVVTASTTTTSITPGQTATLSVSSSPAPGSPANYQWFYNGNAITPGGTSSTLTVGIDDLGEYTVELTDVNGCRNMSNTLSIGGTQSDKLWIYPNPSDGQFQVRLYYDGPYTDIRWIHIFDSQGRLVMKKAFDLYPTQPPYMQMSFDMSAFPAGTYVVKVEEKYTGKIKSGLLILH